MGLIRIGTASWTDPTLIQSKLFYPRGCSSAEDRLRFYSSHFPMVEVDSSYYAMPSERNAQLWAERTPDGFTFNLKAFRIFTGHQTPAKALPPDIARELAPLLEHKRNIYYKDLPDSIRDEMWQRFERAVQPLRDAGKLTALHFQFAPWVIPSPDWKRHLEECVGRLPGHLLAFEFRNRAWYDGRHDGMTLAMERDLGVAHVVVDEPQVGARSIPQVWDIASPRLAIVRMHGRNHAKWESKAATVASDRFDYDYSDDELTEIATPIRDLAQRVAELHVVFNNNQGDQGQRNGLSLMRIMGPVTPCSGDTPSSVMSDRIG